MTEHPVFRNSSGEIPRIGLGTFQNDGDSCRASVNTALQVGYRHIDTARMYENEREVGAGIRDSGVRREDIFVTTKLQMGHLEPHGVKESCAISLSNIGTDYLDLLLIHWPEEAVPLADTLGALSDLHHEGKIRHFGVSNFTVDWLQRAIDVSDEPIFCNQVEYHPFLNQQTLLDLCRRNDIALTAYSPLARGKVIEDKTLAAIAQKYDKSPAQITLRWLLQQPGVVAIPKGSSSQHIRDNLDVFDFELSDADMRTINELRDASSQRLIDPVWAPEWDA
jgi:diketogulonate reductase-like aldo/keto reductase